MTPVEEEAVYEETELTNEDNDAVQQDDQEVSMDTISMDTISLTQVLNDYSEDDLPPEIAAYGNALASMADGKTQLLDVTGAAVMNELKVESLGAKGVGYAFDDYDNPEQNDMFGEQSQSLYSYGMGDVSPYSFSEEGAPLPSLDSRQGILRQASPRVMDRIIGMEYDGQLNFVVPEAEKIEKQITGQLSIDDILLEWEKTKKENQEKREEDVRQRVLEQTGNMFKEFDEAYQSRIVRAAAGNASDR